MRNHLVLDRRGFALPVTVFIVTLLTIMLATGFARVRADSQIGMSSEYTTDAFAVAQSGLQTYIGTRTSRPPDGDSVRINVPGGYAWVVSRAVQRPADTLLPQTYIVRSTGYAVEPTISSEPQARRTVAQFAAWQIGTMETRGALVAANGLVRLGGGSTVLVRGQDVCNEEPPVPGFRTTVFSGSPNPPMDIQGSPPILEEGAGAGGSIATATGIDWAATIGDGLVPHYTSIQPASSEWSIQRIQGDATLSNTWGTGLLIVTGDLVFSGSTAYWFGVVLVGGRIQFNANTSYVRGTAVSGLNAQLGQNPSQTIFGGAGRRLYVYNDACFKRYALESLTGFVQIPNAWIDNWATY